MSDVPCDWPRLADPDLVARLRMPTARLYRTLGAYMARMPASVVDPDLHRRLAWGRDYPFPRADRQVVVHGQTVTSGGELPDDAPRWPLLAIGSNASPGRLAGKFTGVVGDAVRLTPAALTGYDVCALPYPVSYGAFPAGLAPSPGTRVQVAVLEVTEAQVEWLALTEFGYHFGALEGVAVDLADGRTLDRVLVFVQRPGLFALDGAPVALAAVPAEGRTLRALTQAELADEWVRRRLGPGVGRDEGLVRAVADLSRFVAEYQPPSLADAVQPEVPGFVPHPASRTGEGAA